MELPFITRLWGTSSGSKLSQTQQKQGLLYSSVLALLSILPHVKNIQRINIYVTLKPFVQKQTEKYRELAKISLCTRDKKKYEPQNIFSLNMSVDCSYFFLV